MINPGTPSLSRNRKQTGEHLTERPPPPNGEEVRLTAGYRRHQNTKYSFIERSGVSYDLAAGEA